jgi:hypothetical protein
MYIYHLCELDTTDLCFLLPCKPDGLHQYMLEISTPSALALATLQHKNPARVHPLYPSITALTVHLSLC